jgi:hypothetical protein
MRLLYRNNGHVGFSLVDDVDLEKTLSPTKELRPTNGFSLTEDLDGSDKIPPYAVLSHTWGMNKDEVSFRDMALGLGTDKFGYKKLEFCAEQAERDGLRYFWVDTCCIDKSNSAELSEAINSMFRWYQQSSKCYVYLSDLSVEDDEKSTSLECDPKEWDPAFRRAFRSCKWFTRGWTLQELIAPHFVNFFSKEGTRIGSRTSLIQEIHEITGIPVQALHGHNTDLPSFSVTERLSWTSNRATKREEDAAYCLLGLFDVHMPLIYGERQGNAFARLRDEIDKRQFRGPHLSLTASPASSPTSTVPSYSSSFTSSGSYDTATKTETVLNEPAISAHANGYTTSRTRNESKGSGDAAYGTAPTDTSVGNHFAALPWSLYQWTKDFMTTRGESAHTTSAKGAEEKQASSRQPMSVHQAGSAFSGQITVSGGAMYQGNSIRF